MNVRKVGRPRKGEKTEMKGFRLSEYFCRKLETYPNQTTIVTEALERYFDIEGKKKQWLYKERDKHQQIINSLNIQIEQAEKEEIESENRELELKEEYKEFIDYLKNYLDDGTYKTKAVNEKFGITLKDYKHFQQLQNKHEKGDFSIEDFKNLHRGNEK